MRFAVAALTCSTGTGQLCQKLPPPRGFGGFGSSFGGSDFSAVTASRSRREVSGVLVVSVVRFERRSYFSAFPGGGGLEVSEVLEVPFGRVRIFFLPCGVWLGYLGSVASVEQEPPCPTVMGQLFKCSGSLTTMDYPPPHDLGETEGAVGYRGQGACGVP